MWAWTDWATDGSGFQYAQVNRIHTSSSAVHVVDKDAFPGDMSADGAGLYFETVHGVTDDLARANPTTSAVQYRKAPVDAPLALAGGRVDLLAFGTSAADVLSYNASTLALVSSKRVPETDDSIVGTGLGLLVLAQPCGGFPCSSATVGLLNAGHRRHVRARCPPRARISCSTARRSSRRATCTGPRRTCSWCASVPDRRETRVRSIQRS